VIYFQKSDNLIEVQLIEHILSTNELLSTKYCDAGGLLYLEILISLTYIAPLLSDKHSHQMVDKPTPGRNVLDKIITNISDFYGNVQITSQIGLSDHNTIFWFPMLPQTRKPHVI